MLNSTRLAHHHLQEAEKIRSCIPQPAAWLKAKREGDKRKHLQFALIVISLCGGRRVRAEARKLLGEMT